MKCNECNVECIYINGEYKCRQCLLVIDKKIKYNKDYQFVDQKTLRTKTFVKAKKRDLKGNNTDLNKREYLHLHKKQYWKIYLLLFQIKLKDISTIVAYRLNINNKEIFLDQIKCNWFKILEIVKNKEIILKSNFLNQNIFEFIFENEVNLKKDVIDYNEIFNFENETNKDEINKNLQLYEDNIKKNKEFNIFSKRKIIKKKIQFLDNYLNRRKSSIIIDIEYNNFDLIYSIEDMVFKFMEKNISLSIENFFNLLFKDNNWSKILEVTLIEYIIKLYIILKLNIIDFENNVLINKKRCFKNYKFINLVKIDIFENFKDIPKLDSYYISNNIGLFMVIIFIKDYLIFKESKNINSLEDIKSEVNKEYFIKLFSIHKPSYDKIMNYFKSFCSFIECYNENNDKFKNNNTFINLDFSLIFNVIYLSLKLINFNIIFSDFYKLINTIKFSDLFKKSKLEEEFMLKENIIFYYKERLINKNFTKSYNLLLKILKLNISETKEELILNYKMFIINKLKINKENLIFNLGIIFFENIDYDKFLKNFKFKQEIIISWIIINSFKIAFYNIHTYLNDINSSKQHFFIYKLINDMIFLFNNLSKLIYESDNKEPQVENMFLTYKNIKKIKLSTLRNIYLKTKKYKRSLIDSFYYDQENTKDIDPNKIKDFVIMLISDDTIIKTKYNNHYIKINKYFNYLFYLLRKYFIIDVKEFCFKISKLDKLIK